LTWCVNSRDAAAPLTHHASHPQITGVKVATGSALPFTAMGGAGAPEGEVSAPLSGVKAKSGPNSAVADRRYKGRAK